MSYPELGARCRVPVENGRCDLLLNDAGECATHRDRRYDRIRCTTCGESFQQIDFRCARHSSHCPSMIPAPGPGADSDWQAGIREAHVAAGEQEDFERRRKLESQRRDRALAKGRPWSVTG